MMEERLTGFVDHSVEGMDYQVYAPRFELDSPPPIILFLHGRGESGTDGIKQSAIGLGHAIRMNSARWPFIVILPQKPSAEKLWPEYQAELNSILQAVEERYPHDETRRYLTGLSQGGNGTIALCTELRWKFAAIAPVCGWSGAYGSWIESGLGERLKELPMWAFHGDDDPVIPVSASRYVVEEVKKAGGQAELTEYPKVGHNSWDSAYAQSDMPQWFLRHVRK